MGNVTRIITLAMCVLKNSYYVQFKLRQDFGPNYGAFICHVRVYVYMGVKITGGLIGVK